jgi:hypothetical protein
MADAEGKVIEEKPQSPYVYEPNAIHLVIIVFDPKVVRTEPLKVRLSDFNKKEFRTRTFNVKSVVLDDAHTIVTIGSFENQSKAADYITALFLTDYVFGGIDKAKYNITPISLKNYPIFYQSKDYEEYNTFFESNNKN